MGGTVSLGVGALMRGTAIASIDPNSYSGRIFSASHYGPFEAIVRDGKLVNISAMIELGNRPTEMLMYGLQDHIYDKTRIAGPMIRKSCLEGWQTGDSKPELRGKERFVQVDWDTAFKIAAKAIVDTAANHGNRPSSRRPMAGGAMPA